LPFVTLVSRDRRGAYRARPRSEDYEFGLKIRTGQLRAGDDAGKFTEDVEHFGCQFVFDANDNVIKKLDEVGALMDMFPCSILSALLAL